MKNPFDILLTDTDRIQSIITEIDFICDEYKTIDPLGYDYPQLVMPYISDEDIPKYEQIILKYGCKYNSRGLPIPHTLTPAICRAKLLGQMNRAVHTIMQEKINIKLFPETRSQYQYSEIIPKLAKMMVENVENIVVFYDGLKKILIDYFVMACELYAINPTMSQNYEEHIYLCYINLQREYKIKTLCEYKIKTLLCEPGEDIPKEANLLDI